MYLMNEKWRHEKTRQLLGVIEKGFIVAVRERTARGHVEEPRVSRLDLGRAVRCERREERGQ